MTEKKTPFQRLRELCSHRPFSRLKKRPRQMPQGAGPVALYLARRRITRALAVLQSSHTSEKEKEEAEKLIQNVYEATEPNTRGPSSQVPPEIFYHYDRIYLTAVKSALNKYREREERGWLNLQRDELFIKEIEKKGGIQRRDVEAALIDAGRAEKGKDGLPGRIKLHLGKVEAEGIRDALLSYTFNVKISSLQQLRQKASKRLKRRP